MADGGLHPQAARLAERVVRDNGPLDRSDEGKLARAVLALVDVCDAQRERIAELEAALRIIERDHAFSGHVRTIARAALKPPAWPGAGADA